uniref:Uncharacterized protein n=1 Tax=Anopheles farauti TaxID=69004 RepID=A0A182QLQ6_9DIPT
MAGEMVVIEGATVTAGLFQKTFGCCCGTRWRKFCCTGANVVGGTGVVVVVEVVVVVLPARIDVKRTRLGPDTLRLLRRSHSRLIKRTFRGSAFEGVPGSDRCARLCSEELERIVDRCGGACSNGGLSLLTGLRIEAELLLRLLIETWGRGDGDLEVVASGRASTETLLNGSLGCRGGGRRWLMLLHVVERIATVRRRWLYGLLSERSRRGDDGLSKRWDLRLLRLQNGRWAELAEPRFVPESACAVRGVVVVDFRYSSSS